MSFFCLAGRQRSANVDTTNVNNSKYSSQGKSRFAYLGYLAAAGVVTLGVASSAQAQTTCNADPRLTGTYGLYANGTQSGSSNLKALTGTVVFDGKCGLTGKITVNENGITSPAFTATTGNYNTSADGSIVVNLTVAGTSNTETYVVSYVPSFHEMLGNETDSSALASIDLKPMVSTGATPPAYSLTSLKGTFGASGVYHDQVTFTFDGAGNLAVIDRTPANPLGVAATGTYAMQGTDGSFGGSITLGSLTLYYGAALNNDTNEFQMVVNSGPNSGYVPLEVFAAKRTTPPATATLCAVDNGTCAIPANTTATVWYGAGNTWDVFPYRSGSFTCLPSTFGVQDPLNGVQKSCLLVKN